MQAWIGQYRKRLRPGQRNAGKLQMEYDPVATAPGTDPISRINAGPICILSKSPVTELDQRSITLRDRFSARREECPTLKHGSTSTRLDPAAGVCTCNS